jgi:phosphoesterase RecJ-like protein
MMNPTWAPHVTSDVATLLLTGLITDTRSFQNPNTTPHSLEVAANLLDLGARQQEIIQHVYKTKPLSTLKIWGRASNRIQVDPDARIVWSAVSREDLQEMGASSKETHGLLDELITTVPDADVHVLFTEVEEGGFKASLRSSPAVDVNRAAGKLFQGGGHARASGFKMKNYGNFQLKVIECVKLITEEMANQRAEAQSAPKIAPKDLPQATKKPAPQPEPKAATPSVDVVAKLGSDGAPKTDSTDIVKTLGS